MKKLAVRVCFGGETDYLGSDRTCLSDRRAVVSCGLLLLGGFAVQVHLNGRELPVHVSSMILELVASSVEFVLMPM